MLALLGPIASLLGIELTSMVERYKRDAVVWSLVGGFLLLALIFGLVAANAALTLSFGPVVAPLILCAVAMAGALVTYGVWHMRLASEARVAAERRKSSESTALVTSVAMSALPLLAKSRLFRKAGLPVGGLLAAAYLLTRQSSTSDEEL